MPYIEQNDREQYKKILEDIKKNGIATAGDLNYIITCISNIYLNECGECYKTYNEIIGVLECAKLEYYRKNVAIYENKKIKENGDV